MTAKIFRGFSILLRINGDRQSGETVSNAGDCLDNWRRSELVAKPADCDEHSLRERVRVFVPDLFEQVFASQDGARAHQGLEQSEFLCGKLEQSTASAGLVPQRIEFDVNTS